MRKLLLFFGIGLLSVVAYGQAPTAACAGATLLTVGGACGTGTISDATVVDATAPSCGAVLRDGWFRFVATGTSIDVTAITTNRQLVLQAFAACGGAEIGCVNANTTAGAQTEILSLTGLTIGNTYYIRVVNSLNSNMTLTTLCITIPPLTIGTGTSTTSAYPYQGYYHDARSQFIITKDELIAQGFCNGSSFTSLAFNVSSKYSTQPYSGFTIQMGHTASSNFASAAWLTPAWTNCYNANWTTATGWNTHNFSTNFVWNGVDNIVIQTCFDNSSYTDYEYIYYTTTSDYKVCYAEIDASTGCTLAAESRSYSRPNMRFNYNVGATCSAAPAGGTAVATPNSINCTVTSSVISATGLSSDCGITYQWQSAPAAGGPWSNIAGATNTTYTANPSSNTYYRIVSTCPTGPWSSNSTSVLLSSTFSPPANDNCANATALTVNANYACGTTTAGTVSCASQSADAEGCGGTSDDDVWYKFVATSTSHRISLINVAGSTTDMYHSIYSGSCGSLTEMNCNDADVTNLTGLTIGNTYYVRVYTWTSTGGQTSTFDVCVGTPPPPPSNDAPCSSILATVNADLLCGSVTAGYTTSATNSGIAACAGTADDDVWFSFVATSTVHNFDLLNITGTVTNMVHEIFSGACGGLSSVACSDPNSSQFSGFTIGQTYFIRVYTNSAVAQTVDFELCIGTPPPPPSNDEPCGAIDLNVNIGACAFQSAVLGTTSTVSVGMPAPGCGSLGPDIWYKFTVPASGRIIIDMAPNGGPTDMDMAWYTSSTNDCNNLTTLVDCDDADSQNGAMAMICHAGASCVVPGDCQQLATLTPGTVVYVRLWEYGGTPFGPFDICAYDPGAPGAASTCASATVIPSLPYSNAGQTTCCRGNNITMASANVCSSSYMDGEDFLYSYTPTVNESIDITLTGTLSYTGLFVASKCPSAGGPGACIASATSSSGNPVLCGVALTAGTTYYIMVDTDPTPTCTPFNINISSSTTPSCGLNYTLASIGNAPDLNAGTDIALPIDDRFSSSYTPIGFNFCFDGYGFSQLLVSSNGYVIFDPIGCASNMPSGNAAPGATSDWSISAAIPNTTDAPRNAILFPWQDINPALGGTIKYQTLGVAPNRRFVLTFDQIPYYSCTAKKFTGQLKLFETSNTIEVHITKNETCASWNSGAAILGIHNFNGTVALTPAGHNYPTNWAENNKGYRFTSNCVGCIILPVKLMSFTAKGETDYNLLNWMTATEINNDYFIVESSMDMVHFKEIGRVDGAGNSNNVLSYQFTDNNAPFEKIMYYRLKQVDFDGVYAYSDVVAVKKINEGDVNIYPNPAKDMLFIDVNSVNNETYTVNYFNVLGSVSKEQIIVSEGKNTYQTNEFKNLKPGIYFIQVVDANNEVIKHQKIVKE